MWIEGRRLVIENIVALVISVLVVGYLIYALIRPEKF